MKKLIIFFVLCFGFCFTGSVWSDELADFFHNAPASLPNQKLTLKGMPLWHMNGLLTSELIQEFFEKGKASGFAGYTVLPMTATQPKFLTEEYFKLFGEILETARKNEMKIVFYDDINFPSGSAGGKMATVFPEDTLKRLDKVEWEFQGPGHFTAESPIAAVEKTSFQKPGGVLMSAVAMNTETCQRINLEQNVHKNRVEWNAPEGTWKIMLFYCVDGNRGLVDYLCPESSEKYLTLTYDVFANRFGEYFGTTIPLIFYDDLALAHVEGYRTWTPAYNTKFEMKYGRSPVLDYPALWYDVGPETTSIRCDLFGFRNLLFSDGHMKVIHEWSQKHHVLSCGHPMGPYIIQPVDMGGDNFLFHKNADVTLFDSIHYYGHGRDGFKIPTSASYNYDHEITAVEIYGNYPDQTVDRNMLYRSAMEIFARGGNLLLPHGTWINEKTMHIPPDIAWKNPRFGQDLPDYGNFVSRCSLLLQGGRHVADIGMVYPIASLTGFYKFFDKPERTHYGSYYPEETDYLVLSNLLTGAVWCDFTMLHPEIIDEKCKTIKNENENGQTHFRLENKTNWEEYPIVLLPGGKVISWSNLQKIKAFHDAGGKVIATSMLPNRSMESGHDSDVRETVQKMFGVDPANQVFKASPNRVRIELKGNTIKTFLNGELIDTTVDETFKQGGIGFREADKESGTFHRLQVRAPDGTILLNDDFKNLAHWVDTTNAKVSDNTLSLHDNQSMHSNIGHEWTDYVLECDVQTDSMAGLTFRVRDSDNYYMWQFNAKNTQLAPHIRKNGHWNRLKTVTVPSYVLARNNGASVKKYGNTVFLPAPSYRMLLEAFDLLRVEPDVRLLGTDGQRLTPVSEGNGMLQYIHKIKDGRNIYFFANSSNTPVEFDAVLRGTFAHLENWNPHDGSMTTMKIQSNLSKDSVKDSAKDSARNTTTIRLILPPVCSTFVVEAK
ncbi:MAG: hypothetical protein LBL62_12190 [Planctomycetaceae bacterium]|jgi:hypothetical protein|nr:hypothetical protein [Planctomycetaceae bacterium]